MKPDRFRKVAAHVLAALLVAASWRAAASDDQCSPRVPADILGRVTEWSIPAPLGARDPAVAADCQVYFAVSKGDRIARFDLRSRTFREWPVPAGTRPHGVAVAADGAVFFGGQGNGTVGELDPRTGTVRVHRTSDPSSGPYSVALDAAGRLWIAEREAGKVAALDRASGKLSEYPMPGEPYGLAIDRRGVVWVTRIAADTLSSIDAQSGKITHLHTGAGSKPRRLALAPDGMLWVTLYGAGAVAKVDPQRNSIVKQYALPGGTNVGPYSVNVDAAGRVWVLEFHVDSVAILDPKSEQFRVVRLPDKNAGARNASIDARGRYWYISMTSGKLGMIE